MAPSTVRPETTRRLARTFAAPRDTAFPAWTDPEELNRWSGSTWRGEAEPAGRETPVTVELRARGGATEVVLIHERFPIREARVQPAAGGTGSPDKLATVQARRS